MRVALSDYMLMTPSERDTVTHIDLAIDAARERALGFGEAQWELDYEPTDCGLTPDGFNKEPRR